MLMAPATVFLPNRMPCGPLENFYSLQVHGRRHSRKRTAPGIYAVDEHPHRLLEAGIGAGAYAADKQVRCARAIVNGDIGDVGGELLQVNNGESRSPFHH